MVVRVLPADVGLAWLGSARPYLRLTLEPSPSGVPRLRREREYQSLRLFRGSAGGMRVLTRYLREAGMQVLYERCAAVDVGKDVIAVAVRLPGGDGPDGRATSKRTFKTFYGVLREAARWLGSLGVTYVAMEATGVTACRSTTR